MRDRIDKESRAAERRRIVTRAGRDGHNTADHMIANFGESEECEGHWLKASVQPDGTFTMTNGRNGYSRTYTAR